MLKEVASNMFLNGYTYEEYIPEKINYPNNNYVFEVPLLAESKLKSHFTKTIFVASKKEIRIKRYKKKGGSINLFRFLDSRQLSPKAKAKYCDYKIVNNGSKNLLNKKVFNIIKLL